MNSSLNTLIWFIRYSGLGVLSIAVNSSASLSGLSKVRPLPLLESGSVCVLMSRIVLFEFCVSIGELFLLGARKSFLIGMTNVFKFGRARVVIAINFGLIRDNKEWDEWSNFFLELVWQKALSLVCVFSLVCVTSFRLKRVHFELSFTIG